MRTAPGEASRQSILVSPISSSADGILSKNKVTVIMSEEENNDLCNVDEEEIEERMRDGDVIPAEGVLGSENVELRAESGGDARLRENVLAQGAVSGGDERLRDDVVA